NKRRPNSAAPATSSRMNPARKFPVRRKRGRARDKIGAFPGVSGGPVDHANVDPDRRLGLGRERLACAAAPSRRRKATTGEVARSRRQPDPIAVTRIGNRSLIPWFAQRENLERLIASTGPDEVMVVDTPMLPLELSLHNTPEKAR